MGEFYISKDSKLIDGRELAARLKKLVAQEVNNLKQNQGIIPGLAVIRVGDDPASLLYVKRKQEQALEVGIRSKEIHLPANITMDDLEQKIYELNDDPKINGILVQLPLPGDIDPVEVACCIDEMKDVDGLSPLNIGMLVTGTELLMPCTPLGCMLLLRERVKDFTGLHAVVIGCSNLVGKPMAQMLLQEDCTVTVTHSKTKNIEELTKQADILVVAAGSPLLVKADWVKPGAIVLDVGITDVRGKVYGDVDYADVVDKVSAITPVPGGVGPMTVACLLLNTTLATLNQHELNPQFLPQFPLRDLNWL